MKAIFVRHGQSTGNAGFPANDLTQLQLTELGKNQASFIAQTWAERPALIVTSPYLRAIQTAEPTVQRFPETQVETWPIHEFTYLEPSRWNGTSRKERLPHIEDYWRSADPSYQDGPGAESFATLLRRAEDAIERLRVFPGKNDVVLFSHGQFMQAIWHTVHLPGWTDKQKMQHFWAFDQANPVSNGSRCEYQFE
jgi:broad specificity phosphatase PhoE